MNRRMVGMLYTLVMSATLLVSCSRSVDEEQKTAQTMQSQTDKVAHYTDANGVWKTGVINEPFPPLEDGTIVNNRWQGQDESNWHTYVIYGGTSKTDPTQGILVIEDIITHTFSEYRTRSKTGGVKIENVKYFTPQPTEADYIVSMKSTKGESYYFDFHTHIWYTKDQVEAFYFAPFYRSTYSSPYIKQPNDPNYFSITYTEDQKLGVVSTGEIRGILPVFLPTKGKATDTLDAVGVTDKAMFLSFSHFTIWESNRDFQPFHDRQQSVKGPKTIQLSDGTTALYDSDAQLLYINRNGTYILIESSKMLQDSDEPRIAESLQEIAR